MKKWLTDYTDENGYKLQKSVFNKNIRRKNHEEITKGEC